MPRRILSLISASAVIVAVASPVARAEMAPDDDWPAFEEGVLDLASLAAWVSGVLPTLSASLVCPVAGLHHFTDTWGEARAWGRTHKGTDVHADRGTPVVAVERGAIVQRGWHWAGGFGVYLRGSLSEDVFYYAHLDWIAPWIQPGNHVEAGDVLGWVGFTGNAETAHLHFAWIPDHGPGWVELDGFENPYALLRNLCDQPGS